MRAMKNPAADARENFTAKLIFQCAPRRTFDAIFVEEPLFSPSSGGGVWPRELTRKMLGKILGGK